MPSAQPADRFEVHFDVRDRIVFIRVFGSPSDEEHQRYLAEMSELVKTARQRRGILFDARQKTDDATPNQRKMTAQFIKQHREALSKQVVGQAFVMRSPMLRALLNAVLFMQPLPYPHKVVDDVEVGRAWLVERLALADG